MENFLSEHTVTSIFRNSFQIFTRNVLTLFLVYTLPTFPFVVLQQEAQAAGQTELFLFAIFLNAFMGFFAFGAITVVISDICLGNRPSVVRSYRKIFGIVGRLLWSNLLQMLAIVAGMLLLIIPGLVLMVRLFLTSTVVVLENISGVAALKRSASLGRGYYWRNFGVMCVWSGILIGMMILLGVLTAAVSLQLGEGLPVYHWAFRTAFAVLVTGLLYPLMFIGFILLYYDLRVRKEAYDVRALAEDLRR
jgi:Uncharacterised protein family (UPF0259)